jgi:predicted transcriptional regulator of viral defense system
MGNRTILKRLGYILDVTGLLPRYEELFVGHSPSAGFTRLDTLSPRTGKHDSRWKLLINCRLNREGWFY